MGRHESSAWHDNGSLVWTWPLTLAVSGVALAAVAVGGVLWAVGATGPGPLGGLALPASVALFVAISGRLISANRMRYEDAEFPAAPPSSPAPVGSGARRRSAVRRSGLAYFYMFLAGGGPAAAALLNWNDQNRSISLLELILGACALSGCYLAGPAARFVVTPEYLHVDSALRRISVPRRLIARFERGFLTLTLRLDGGDHLDVRIDSPLNDMGRSEYRTNIRAQLRTAERIVAMLREVPAAYGTGGQVVTAPRRGMRALAIVTVIVAVAAVVAFPFAVRSS